MSEVSTCEALRTVPGTQEMAVLWSLLLSTRESVGPHSSVITVTMALGSIMSEFEFQFITYHLYECGEAFCLLLPSLCSSTKWSGITPISQAMTRVRSLTFIDSLE